MYLWNVFTKFESRAEKLKLLIGLDTVLHKLSLFFDLIRENIFRTSHACAHVYV